MSHLSNALILALETAKLSQAELADQTHIGAVQINRYMRDRARVTWDGFEKILDVFEPAQQAMLIRAYLLDSVATRFLPLVEIHTTISADTVADAAPPPYEFMGLPADFERALRYIATKSHEKTVTDLIEDLAALLQTGEKPRR